MSSPRQQVPLNGQWLLSLNEQPEVGDASAWETINLPHEVEAGVAHFGRLFSLDESDAERHLRLEFDGVADSCQVWLNGYLLHRNWSPGSFTVDISDVANCGDEPNLLLLRTAAGSGPTTGVFGDVILVKSHSTHVARWGTHIHPVQMPDNRWDTRIETLIENSGKFEQQIEVIVKVLDADREVVGEAVCMGEVEPNRTAGICQYVEVDGPKLWCVDSPALYQLQTQVLDPDGNALDETETTFGYRSVSNTDGWMLNGKPFSIDTFSEDAPASNCVDWIISVKNLAKNAWVSGPRAPAPAFLDGCDRFGLPVIIRNHNVNSSPEAIMQLANAVMRDRNHPCVIGWSLAPEAVCGDVGQRILERLEATLHDLDRSRPILDSLSG